MTTYYNTHMTAVPTRLLLDTNLSAEAKLTGALLYTFEDGGLIIRKKQGLGKPALITLNYPADARLIAKECEDAQA